MKKLFGLSFLVSSSLADFGEHFSKLQCIQAENLQVLPSFRLRLTSCSKIEVYRKRLLFQCRNFSGLCFVEFDRHQVAIKRRRLDLLKFNVEVIRTFFLKRKRSQEIFWRKAIMRVKIIDFGLFFSRITCGAAEKQFLQQELLFRDFFWPPFSHFIK